MSHCQYSEYERENLYKVISKDYSLDYFSGNIHKHSKLRKALKYEGPFTVFAPSSKAFYRSEAGHGTLEEILSYSIIPKFLPTRKLKKDQLLPTLWCNKEVRVNTYHEPEFNEVVTINGVPVKDSVEACNGVLHKINKVLYPPTKSIWRLVCAMPELSIFRDLIECMNLQGEFSENGLPLTLFAPTDTAFNKLAKKLKVPLWSLMDYIKGDQEYLHSVILYHLLGWVLFTAAFRKDHKQEVCTVDGRFIRVKKKCNYGIPELLVIDKLGRKAEIILADVIATNGTLHVIDEVLLPSSNK